MWGDLSNRDIYRHADTIYMFHHTSNVMLHKYIPCMHAFTMSLLRVQAHFQFSMYIVDDEAHLIIGTDWVWSTGISLLGL